MAEETQKKGWFRRHFNLKSIAWHTVGPFMILMMTAMSLPAVAAVASAAPAGATFGDIGLATLDHFKTMFTAPFTDGGVVVDAFKNAAHGNWAPTPSEANLSEAGRNLLGL